MRLWWLETWSLISLGLMFLMLTISYLEQLKLPRNCLCFWLSCQKTRTSVPHHIADQWLVMRGGAERLHRKMAAKTGLPPIQREHREQSGFDQRLSWENMEGDRSIKLTVLLGCTCTKNWFLEYMMTVTCRSTYWASVHASGLGKALYGTTLPAKWALEPTKNTALEQMMKERFILEQSYFN